MLKAVLFDFDGVVVDSEPLIFEAARKVFAGYGVDLTLEDVRPGIGAGTSYVELPMRKYGISGVTAEELVARRAEEYLKIANTRLRKVEGFDALVGEIRKRGGKTALASSSTNDWVVQSLRAASVDPFSFDLIVQGDAVPRKKPFPDLFLNALKGLGISSSDGIVIEDAVTGIAAARAAGIRSIGLVGTMPAEALSSADFVVSSLYEAREILSNLLPPPHLDNRIPVT
jgi:HAD superfamily hydrolase (TIGR01509 family)